MGTKDATIEALVARLNLPARGWTVVDHWEADRCAIGIASAREPDRLVYVSTFGKRNGLFSYECELPSADPENMYRVAGEGTDVHFEELLEVMISHLGGAGDVPSE
ncbi:MAG: hypothetical protein ACTHU0_15695 [Kofleriaceae bacterium]